MIILLGILYFSLMFSSEPLSWKNNVLIFPGLAVDEDFANYKPGGRFHVAYQAQVFTSTGHLEDHLQSEAAFQYCLSLRQAHIYQYSSDELSFFGYFKSGYHKDQKRVDFFKVRDSFERYCYFPPDGLMVFYRQYPFLSKTLGKIPFLKVLVPYWMKGDCVLQIGLDKLQQWLPKAMHPDIPFNVLYNHGDPEESVQDARVLYYQLKKTGTFTDVFVQKVSGQGAGHILEPEIVDMNDEQLKNTVKLYENRQWWLRNLWVSKLAIGLAYLMLGLKLILWFNYKNRRLAAFVVSGVALPLFFK